MSIQQTTLGNGMIVATDSAPNFNGVAVNIGVKAGSVHEPDGLQGMAHLLEHLLFRSTTKSCESTLQARIGQLGANLNGMTEEGQTSYTAEVLKDHLEDTLLLMGEMLCHPLFDAQHISLEKQIIENENCRGCGGCTMRDAVFGEAFPDQSLRHPVIGYEDTLETISRSDLQAFHDKMYVTGNVIVTVAGDVDHGNVVNWIETAFADMTVSAGVPYPAFDYHPGEILIGSGGDRAGIRICYDLTHLTKEQYRPFAFFEDILGGHGHSRLMEELREKRGLVYSCWTEWHFVAGRRLLTIDAWGEARKMKEIAQVIAQTARETADLLTDAVVDAAKLRCRTGLLMQQDNMRIRAETLTENIMDGDVREVEDDIAAYLGTTGESIRAAGHELLSLDPVIFLGGSHRQMPKFSDVRAALKGGSETPSAKLRLAS